MVSGTDASTTRFAALLDRAEQTRGHPLGLDELQELAQLYRRHTSRLARLRIRVVDPALLRYLNALCVRAYTHLHLASAPRAATLRKVLAERLPAALARSWHALVLSWCLLGLGVVVGGILGTRDVEAVHVFMPCCMGYTPARIDRLAERPEERAAFLAREATDVGQNAAFGSALFVNNTRVGLLAFASGVLGAVPTVLLLVYNGLMLGAFASLFFHDPWPIDFLAWILPHGIPELTAIALSGAGGLVLGQAVAAPLRAARRAALRAAVGPALLLFASSLPLFAVAAMIESFVRESALGTAPRLACAGLVLVTVLAALFAVRRGAQRAGMPRSWIGELIAVPLPAAPGSAPARAR